MGICSWCALSSARVDHPGGVENPQALPQPCGGRFESMSVTAKESCVGGEVVVLRSSTLCRRNVPGFREQRGLEGPAKLSAAPGGAYRLPAPRAHARVLWPPPMKLPGRGSREREPCPFLSARRTRATQEGRGRRASLRVALRSSSDNGCLGRGRVPASSQAGRLSGRKGRPVMNSRRRTPTIRPLAGGCRQQSPRR
jgi:hypothetical protein